LMPRLARLLKEHKYDDAITIWGNSVEVSLIIIGLFSFGLMTYAPEALALLYSDKYLPGVSVFQIYSLVLLLRVTYFGMILNSMGKTKFIFYSSVLSLVLNVILNYALYLVFGFIGPAIATIIALTAVIWMQLQATSKTISIPMRRIFPWLRLVKILLINAVFALVFYGLKQVLDLQVIVGQIGEALILGAIWSGLYMGLHLKSIRASMRKLNV
jgi:O-antigen/teichoic acid export membrane protein